MTDTAESLARDVIEGRYTLSVIDDCEAELPIDRNPQVIRYRSFFLFVESGPAPTSFKEPGYLILAQYKLRNRDPIPERPILDHSVGKHPAPSVPIVE